jgi:RimJ/RimL family protein N-acetyltransferase
VTGVQVRELIDSDLPQIYDFHNDAASVRMAVVLPRDAEVCGYGITFARAGLRELGYWIGREHWGQGLATMLAGVLVQLDPTRPLHGVVAAHNLASRRVLEKCGFQLAGTVDDLPRIAGQPGSGYMLRLDIT